MLNRNFLILSCTVLAAFLYLNNQEALAQSSLGLGRSEQAIKPEGMFAGLLFWIQQQQQSFYKLMTSALQTMRDGESAFWYLTGLSFLYGILHAAGPGHGKAVISSYMLANEVAAKRGIMLSFASSMLQGLTAVVIIGAILLFLRGTGIKTSNLSGSLEISSYFLVMMLGLYMIWIKVFANRKTHVHMHHDDLVPAHAHGHDHSHGHSHDHSHAHNHHHHSHNHGNHDHSEHGHGKHEHSHSHAHHHDHDHVHGPDCGCGHNHAADPSMLEGELDRKQAWAAIMAVGIRPCTGAIVVLTFAFLNGLYAAGIASTFAMSIGTGITVATLALMAVGAKNIALRVTNAQSKLSTIHRMIEVAGALLVFLLGFLLFSAALTA